MSVAPLPSAPRSTGNPFAGVDVAAAAGLEVRPGAPRPVFDQEVWDLSGLVGAPVTMGAHRKILDCTRIVNHRWRTVAREYLLARIAPRHPAVTTLPSAFRAPFNPTSLWGELNHLARWFDHLHHAGLVSLAEVGQEHCDTYLEEVSWTTTGTRRRMRPVVVAAFVRSAQVLTLYADILSDTYTPGFRPWGARGADDVAGYVRTKTNLVLPVPDALLRPMLADALYLVDTIGPHLAPEAERARTADQQEVASRRYLAVEELPLLAEAIETHRAAGVPAPCLAAGTVTKRLAAGWEPDDPLLGVAWHSVVVAAVGAMGQRRDLERLRPALQRWVAECGTEQRWCRSAGLVGRLDTDELVPWSLPTDRDHLASMVSTVTSAALYVTSVLSGMPSSELHELTARAARREERPGGAARYRVVSRRIKGEAFGGVEDSWVVLEDVFRALRIAEALTGAAPGGLLFAKESNVAHARYTRMRSWINGPAGQRLGLMAIPDGPVNPRALRRTLALSIAQRPHGLMAAKVHLKHVSVATTEGYAARPGGHQAAFLAEVAAGRASRTRTPDRRRLPRLPPRCPAVRERGTRSAGLLRGRRPGPGRPRRRAGHRHRRPASRAPPASQGRDPPRRRRQLLLVLRPEESPVPRAGRHPRRGRADDRDVRLGPLPPGHPSPRAPPSLSRPCHLHKGRLPRQPPAVQTRTGPCSSRVRSGHRRRCGDRQGRHPGQRQPWPLTPARTSRQGSGPP